MVRAATTGAIDYSRADPTSKHWRIHQHLILAEIRRQEDVRLLEDVHRHWLAYLSNGRLDAEAFQDTRTHANEVILDIRQGILPWIKQDRSEVKKDTIDDENEKLMARYREFKAKLDAENAARAARNG